MGILFGLTAVIMPAYAIIKQNKKPVKRPYIYSSFSFASALITLTFVLVSIKQRAINGDYGGIEDTIGALVVIAAAFTVFVVLINLLMLGLYYEKQKD